MKGKVFRYAGALLAAGLAIHDLRRPASPRAISIPSPAAVKNVPPAASDAIPIPVEPDASLASQDAGARMETPPTGTQPDGEVQMNRVGDTDTQLKARLEWLSRLRDWAANDPDRALAWVLNLPAGQERDQALPALCFGLAQTDPAHAVEMAQTLHQPEDVMENLVQQWAANDVVSALVWANNLPAGGQRDQLLQRVTYVLSQTDPSDAAGLVLEQIPPGPAQDETVMTVVHQWGNQNLQAANAWVLTFPDGPLKERATEELNGIAQYKNALAHL